MRYLILLFTIPIFSCSTYMENKIGQDFKSIQPDFTKVEDYSPQTEELIMLEIS